MHIAIYHDALIPPLKYGGTERIVYWLAKALVVLGNRVSLISKPGSHVPGVEHIPYSNPKHSWETLIPPDVDLVHLWGTPRTPPEKPFLVTIEGNGQLGEKFHSNTIFVSKKHAENHGSHYFVHNGIDVSEFESEPIRDDYFVFLAKANWKVKNLEGAIKIARKCGVELKVMGTRFSFPIQWRGVQSLGMVGDLEKRKVLKKAKALLFPVRWHEPFGIAIIEALAAGCPVFGTPYGSLPEIITPEVGYLSNRADEIVQALTTAKISSRFCQRRALENFTHIQMAKNYLIYYQEILEKGNLNQKTEHLGLRASNPPDTLLPWIDLDERPRKS